MANYVSGPIFAGLGIVLGVISKTKEWTGTILGRDDTVVDDQAEQTNGEAQHEAGDKEVVALVPEQ